MFVLIIIGTGELSTVLLLVCTYLLVISSRPLVPNSLRSFYVRSSNKFITSLHFCSDIYDLCVIGMYSVAEQVQSPAKKVEMTNDISYSEWPPTQASTDVHNCQ